MGTAIEAPRATAPTVHRGYLAFVGLFGLLSVIRGVDRIADDHPLSGWLLLVSGTALTLAFVRLLWRSRSARRPSREQ